MRLALQAAGPWLCYAALQNLIPSFPWMAPPRPPWRDDSGPGEPDDGEEDRAGGADLEARLPDGKT